MSDKVGYYVHYSGSGYDAHGVTLSGKYSDPAAINTQVMQDMQNDLANKKSGLTQAEMTEYGEMISSFMKEPTATDTSTQALAALEADLWDHFQEIMDQGVLNTSNMTISGVSTANSLGKVSAHRTGDGSALYLDLKEITNKINDLERIILEKTNQKSFNTKEMRSLKQQYKDLVGVAVGRLKKYDFTKNDKELSLVGSYTDISKIRDTLNGLIEKYAKYPAISSVEGLAFEDAIAMATYAADATAEQTADEYLKEAVKGAEVNITSQYNTNLVGQAVKQQLGEDTFLESTYSQRSKVDVALTWNEKDLNISAKNVSIGQNYGWITVVTGSPLFYMLQEIDVDWLNHWLNLHAVHGKTEHDSASMDETVKQYLFYKAVTGDTFGRDGADDINLMVANNKLKPGDVIVVDIYSLIKRALEAMQYVSVTIGEKQISNIRFQNVWNKTSWEGRIASLLQEIHDLKVKAMFNGAPLLY